MAQKRLRDYKDPLGSFEHNLINLGVHFPGRFCGFDTLVATGGLTFTINHSQKGVVTTNVDGTPYGPAGVAMTRQGVIVLEDAPITNLSIVTNVGNASARRDLLVMTHQYTELEGGLDAQYEIVQGVMGNLNFGVLSPYQVALGIIFIPAGADQSSLVSYERMSNPDSGDSPDAKLDKLNTFLATQEFKQKGPVISLPAGPTDFNAPTVPGSKWDLDTSGNSFSVFPFINTDMDLLRIVGGSNQDGVEINILTNNNLRLKHYTALSPAEVAAGYGRIVIDDKYRVNNAYQSTTAGAIIGITLIKLSGSWYVKNIFGLGVNPTIAPVVDLSQKILATGSVHLPDIPPDGTSVVIDLTFANLPDVYFIVMGSFVDNNNASNPSTVQWSLTAQSPTSMTIWFQEFKGSLQDLFFTYAIISIPKLF